MVLIRRKTFNLPPTDEAVIKELQEEANEKITLAVNNAAIPTPTFQNITTDGAAVSSLFAEASSISVNGVVLPAATIGTERWLLNNTGSGITVTVFDNGTENIRAAATTGSTVTSYTHAAGTAKHYICYNTGKWLAQ